MAVTLQEFFDTMVGVCMWKAQETGTRDRLTMTTGVHQNSAERYHDVSALTTRHPIASSETQVPCLLMKACHGYLRNTDINSYALA